MNSTGRKFHRSSRNSVAPHTHTQQQQQQSFKAFDAATSEPAGSIILSMTFTPVEQYVRKAQETALKHKWNDPHDRTVNRPPGNSTKWGMSRIGRIAPAHYSRRVNMRARTSTLWS